MNAGVSIIIRADGDLDAVQAFLSDLVMHNTYKPIEVFLLAREGRQALVTIRPFLVNFFLCVLPRSSKGLGRVCQLARYSNILIVDMPTNIKEDILASWVAIGQANLKTVHLRKKEQFGTLTNTKISAEVIQNSLIKKQTHMPMVRSKKNYKGRLERLNAINDLSCRDVYIAFLSEKEKMVDKDREICKFRRW